MENGSSGSSNLGSRVGRRIRSDDQHELRMGKEPAGWSIYCREMEVGQLGAVGFHISGEFAILSERRPSETTEARPIGSTEQQFRARVTSERTEEERLLPVRLARLSLAGGRTSSSKTHEDEVPSFRGNCPVRTFLAKFQIARGITGGLIWRNYITLPTRWKIRQRRYYGICNGKERCHIETCEPPWFRSTEVMGKRRCSGLC